MWTIFFFPAVSLFSVRRAGIQTAVLILCVLRKEVNRAVLLENILKILTVISTPLATCPRVAAVFLVNVYKCGFCPSGLKLHCVFE